MNDIINEFIKTGETISMRNSFLASGDFFRLLMSFVNSLNPDQDRHLVGPDLDPNRLTLW